MAGSFGMVKKDYIGKPVIYLLLFLAKTDDKLVPGFKI